MNKLVLTLLTGILVILCFSLTSFSQSNLPSGKFTVEAGDLVLFHIFDIVNFTGEIKTTVLDNPTLSNNVSTIIFSTFFNPLEPRDVLIKQGEYRGYTYLISTYYSFAWELRDAKTNNYIVLKSQYIELKERTYYTFTIAWNCLSGNAKLFVNDVKYVETTFSNIYIRDTSNPIVISLRNRFSFFILFNTTLTDDEILNFVKNKTITKIENLVSILDPTYSNDTHIIDVIGNNVVSINVGLKVFTTQFFVYILKNYVQTTTGNVTTKAVIAIPPNICITIRNSTWEGTFCNQNPAVYPYLPIELAPGTYTWFYGKEKLVDIVSLPKTILGAGTQEATLTTSVNNPLYSYPLKSVTRQVVNETTLNFTANLLSGEYGETYSTPVTDLTKIEKVSLLVTVTAKYVKPSGYVPILIKNNVNIDLKDYSVQILLDATNFQAWTSVSPDGSDIYFTDLQGNPLYYWIEYINTTAKKAIIWVKIPYLPANGYVLILMHYGGTNPYSNYQDPHKVFIFFDDFETWSGWYKYGYGNVYQDTTYVYQGSYSLKKGDYCDPNGGYKLIGKTITVSSTLGIAVEAWDYRPESLGTDCPVDRFGIEDSNFNGYTTVISRYGGDLGIDVRTGGRPTPHTIPVPLGSVPYFVRLIIFAGKQIIQLYSDPEMKTLVAQYSISDSSYTSFDRVVVHGGRPYWLDNLRVRWYVEPEPSVYVNVSYITFDMLFTTDANPTDTSPFTGFEFVFSSVKDLSQFNLVKQGGKKSWSIPYPSNDTFIVNITWVKPATQGDVYILVTNATGYAWVNVTATPVANWYIMSGVMYLLIGFGTSTSFTLYVKDIKLVIESTYTGLQSYNLKFVGTSVYWVQTGGVLTIFSFVAFTYNPEVYYLNEWNYNISRWISELTLSQATVDSLKYRNILVYITQKTPEYYEFTFQTLYGVLPISVFIENVIPYVAEYKTDLIKVTTPAEYNVHGLLIIGRYRGLPKVKVSAVEKPVKPTEKLQIKLIMITEDATVFDKVIKPNIEIELPYTDKLTFFVLIIAIKNGYLTSFEMSCNYVELFEIPNMGINSSLIIYVPAITLFVDITRDMFYLPSDVHAVVTTFRSVTSYDVLITYTFKNINGFILPMPGVVILEINKTIILDLANLVEVEFDSIGFSPNTTSITVYVTLEKDLARIWKQPFYLCLIASTGLFKPIIGSAYGFGSISASGETYIYTFTLDIPQEVLNQYGKIVVASPLSGLFQTFRPVKIIQQIYLTITKGIEEITKKFVVPLITPEALKIKLPQLPKELLPTTPVLFQLDYTTQGILSIAVLLAIYIFFTRRQTNPLIGIVLASGFLLGLAIILNLPVVLVIAIITLAIVLGYLIIGKRPW